MFNQSAVWSFCSQSYERSTAHGSQANTWQEVTDYSGSPPTVRYSHSAVWATNVMLIFGGLVGSSGLSEAVSFVRLRAARSDSLRQSERFARLRFAGWEEYGGVIQLSKEYQGSCSDEKVTDFRWIVWVGLGSFTFEHACVPILTSAVSCCFWATLLVCVPMCPFSQVQDPTLFLLIWSTTNILLAQPSGSAWQQISPHTTHVAIHHM